MFKEIEQALIEHYQRYTNQTLFIAYSGGIDSQVLLHATSQLIQQQKISNTLAVCHIHHGISDNADKWLAFAKEQSHIYGARFYTKKVNLTASKSESLEALARDARYQVLTEMTNDDNVIITGHHNNDQAETLLLALKRGSGLAGLSGMAATTSLNKRHLIRPLLTLSKAYIQAYAVHYQLTWVEDESNKDNTFDRNFLRNEILPLLTQRWPSIAQTITRSAQHCDDAAQLINEITEADFKECKQIVGNENNSDNILSVEHLLGLSVLRFNYVIRYLLKLNNGLMPSQQQLIQLREQLFSAPDKNPEIKIGQLWLRRYKANLYLTKALNDVSQWVEKVKINNVYEHSPFIIDLPDDLGQLMITKKRYSQSNLFESSSVSENNTFIISVQSELTLSFTHNNPVCLPSFRNKSRTLKKVLQELNIPPWQRKRQLFVFDESELITVAGKFVCQPYLFKHHQIKQDLYNDEQYVLITLEKH